MEFSKILSRFGRWSLHWSRSILSVLHNKNKVNPKLIVSGRKINDKMYLQVIKRV